MPPFTSVPLFSPSLMFPLFFYLFLLDPSLGRGAHIIFKFNKFPFSWAIPFLFSPPTVAFLVMQPMGVSLFRNSCRGREFFFLLEFFPILCFPCEGPSIRAHSFSRHSFSQVFPFSRVGGCPEKELAQKIELALIEFTFFPPFWFPGFPGVPLGECLSKLPDFYRLRLFFHVLAPLFFRSEHVLRRYASILFQTLVSFLFPPLISSPTGPFCSLPQDPGFTVEMARTLPPVSSVFVRLEVPAIWDQLPVRHVVHFFFPPFLFCFFPDEHPFPHVFFVFFLFFVWGLLFSLDRFFFFLRRGPL